MAAYMTARFAVGVPAPATTTATSGAFLFQTLRLIIPAAVSNLCITIKIY